MIEVLQLKRGGCMNQESTVYISLSSSSSAWASSISLTHWASSSHGDPGR